MFNGEIFGNDANGVYVRYAENVADGEKIEGLCEYIEAEYEKIVAFAGELMGDRVKTPARIPVVLSREKLTVKYPNNTKKLVAMLKHHIDVKGKAVTEEEIADILRRRRESMTATGWYYHTGAPFETPCPFAFEDGAKPYVVLFYTVPECESIDDYYAALTQSLAHEYFHTLHNSVTMTTFYKKTPYGKGLKESLSDFFSVLYLLASHEDGDVKLKKAEERIDLWDDYFGSSWAYAHALFYIRAGIGGALSYGDMLESGCVGRFLDVFDTSIKSMKKAYDLLTK